MNSSVESQAVNPSTCSPFETRNERDIFSFAGQTFLIIVNILTFPAAVVLNLFVMAAVKMKRRLRQQKSNILVATLAFTDFLTGLTIQPIFIVVSITALLGKDSWSCSLETFTRPAVACVFSASLHHVVLLSGERLMAMKYPFKHTNFITTSGRFLYGVVVISLYPCLYISVLPNCVFSR